jgi:TolB-like protein
MKDIFLSYSRDDQATARRFAEGLEHAGFSVWWDVTLKSGEDYDKVTEHALESAKAVVVLWSKKSVDSRWVRAEATQADRNHTLVPVMIEPCKRPLMFELKQTAELGHWKGDANDKAWLAFLSDVHQFVNKGAAPVSAAAPTRPSRQHRTVMAMAALALLVIGAGAWALSHRGAPVAEQPVATTTTANTDVTLAVLPFANLSSDPEQEYFSDGLTEEILNQLAQVKQLHLTGRTSSFSFKGKNEDLRVIAEKLGVANLLEGSIRKDGKQLRITAQLINGKDGSHQWSRTYDRELSGIFALQDEIAKDVAKALSITLDVGAMSRAMGGTNNLDAYDKFLQAQAQFQQSTTPDKYLAAAQLYHEAVMLDPDFAKAWVGVYRSLLLATSLGNPDPLLGKQMNEALAKVDALAKDAWWTQQLHASQLLDQRQWLEADKLYQALLPIAPATEIASGYVNFLAETGREQEAIAYSRRLVQAEPLSRSASLQVQIVLDQAGRPEEAQQEYQRAQSLPGTAGLERLFWLMREWSSKNPNADQIRQFFVDAKNLSRYGITADNWNNPQAARAALKKAAQDPANRNVILAAFADHYGEKDLSLDILRTALVDHKDKQVLSLWQSNESGRRADPRFKTIVRDMGLVDYWRTTGKWADYCQPVGSDDFECH